MRTAAGAASGAAEHVRSGQAEEAPAGIRSALPGSDAGRVATLVGQRWSSVVSAAKSAMAGFGGGLAGAADTYDRTEQETEHGFRRGFQPARGVS